MLPPGRTLRAVVPPVYLAPLGCRHEDGRPVAMASYSGAKDDCELPVAQRLLEESAPFLDNATITTDALHTQKKRQKSAMMPVRTTS